MYVASTLSASPTAIRISPVSSGRPMARGRVAAR